MKEISKESGFGQILWILKNNPDGMHSRQIKQALISVYPKYEESERTLQRRLSSLVENGHVIKEGLGKKTRYFLANKPIMENTKFAISTPTLQQEKLFYKDTHLALSEKSLALIQYVEQPLQNRRPVGYNSAFLNNYHPNRSFYLEENTRENLNRLGQLALNHSASTYSKKIIQRLLIDLSWNSSRLEGNTYSLLETERLIVAGEIAPGKSLFETQMIINHKNAIKFLLESKDLIGFNRFTILNLHALLSEGLLGNTEACGRLRTIPVGIHGTVYHPLDIPQKMEEYFQKILSKAEAIENPFEQAFFALVHLCYLQPFEDINKRVSRLSANIPFIKHNLCPLSFIDVPEKAYIDGVLSIYELNKIDLLKDVFIWAYERSSERYAAIQQSLGEPDPFRMRYLSKIKEIASIIIKQSLNKTEAAKKIHLWALENIPKEDYAKFVEMVERELLETHEGNFARFHVTPSEFNKWQEQWNLS